MKRAPVEVRDQELTFLYNNHISYTLFFYEIYLKILFVLLILLFLCSV